MAISIAKLEANRRNAQRSTGPKTEEGKKRSAANAVKHGLTGIHSSVPPNELSSRDKFVNDYIHELNPLGAEESELAYSIAADAWRIHRLRAIEDNMFAVGFEDDTTDPHPDPDTDQALSSARAFIRHRQDFATLSIYEQRITRSLQRNRDAFHKLQEARHDDKRRIVAEEALRKHVQAYVGRPFSFMDRPAHYGPRGFVYSAKELEPEVRRIEDIHTSLVRYGTPVSAKGIGIHESVGI